MTIQTVIDQADFNTSAAWAFACPDWAERLKTGRSILPELPLDVEKAARAVAIFNKLKLPDVEGTPNLADASGEWSRDIVRALFGSIDDDGARHVQQIFAMLPKKNSKTSNGAGIMITALLVNKRARGELLFVGPTQEIADTAFQQASGMIDNDEYLKKRFQVREHVKTIVDRTNKATLKIKTFDMKVMTGAKPCGVLLDEVHIMAAMPNAARVLRQIRGAFAARPDGFLLMITTQSDQAPAGVFKEELDHARAIRDGRVTGDAANVLPMLFEFPEDIQTSKDRLWEDPNLWSMVNPNIGYSIKLRSLVTDFAGEKSKGEQAVRMWASQHLNVQVGLSLHDARWRGADYWESANDPTLTDLDDLIERSEVITIGIDGGGLDDLLGLAVLGRCRKTRAWLLWVHAWCQRDVLELRKEIASRLEDFEKDGSLTICDTATEDIVGLADIVERVYLSGLLPEKHGIGFDPQGVAAMVDELAAREIPNDVCAAVSQGFRLSSAVWGLERKLKDGTFRHAGQPLMAFCVGNAKAEQRGNAVLITKETAGKAKIDPLCATFNAAKLMELNPVAGVGLTPWDSDENFRMSA